MKQLFVFFLYSIVFAKTSFSQVLSDGEYMIKVIRTGKYLSIAGASRDNGARLIQWDNEYTTHFMFLLKHLGNNIYTLKAKHSGKYLSVEGTPTAGAKIIQWDWANQDNQKWLITKETITNGYSIRCAQNNMRVTMQNWNATTATPGNGVYTFITDNTSVILPLFDFKKNETGQIEGNKTDIVQKATGYTSQRPIAKTFLADIPDGIYKIRINESGKYLAIAGQEDMTNGMRLIQWDMLPRNNHLFEIKRIPNKTSYIIKAVHSQKVLDVVDMRTDDGTQIQQWDNLWGENQQWKFQNENNGVSIVSVASGKKLQLSAGITNSSNGTPLIIAANATQTFSLLPARAIAFTEYITLKNVRFTVPKGGDLSMYGLIEVYMIDKYGNSYNRYYASPYRQEVDGDNVLFFRSENKSIDMNALRVADFGGEVKLKISSEELSGAKIIVKFKIFENDADVSIGDKLWTSLRYSQNNDPNAVRNFIENGRFRGGGGSDDLYVLRNSFTNCFRIQVKPAEFNFTVSEIPSSCLVHVNLQDEDGSDNWLDVFFTVEKERKN